MRSSGWTLTPVGAGSPGDDAALRCLLRETPLTGFLKTTLEREPSFFGADADVVRHDCVLARYGGEPAACGSRVVRRTWRNGEPEETAYLSDLRVHPRHQGRAGRIMARGFRGLEELAAFHPAPSLTWTAVFENNLRARAALTGRSAGLPVYTDRGRLVCPALAVPLGARAPRLAGISWERGEAGDAEEIMGFLNARRRHRPLAPVLTVGSFGEDGRWPGLNVGDFLLARRAGSLVGTAAVWDQRSNRQVRIHGLPGQSAWLAAAWRAASRITGWPPPPEPGGVLAVAHVFGMAVEGDDPALARGLILAARALAAERGLHWLCVCLHQDDPLVPALRGLPGVPSHGRIYQVSRGEAPWPEGDAPVMESGLL